MPKLQLNFHDLTTVFLGSTDDVYDNDDDDNDDDDDDDDDGDDDGGYDDDSNRKRFPRLHSLI